MSSLDEQVLSCCPPAESSVLMQDESRSLGDVAINMESQSNPLQLQLIDEQVKHFRIILSILFKIFFDK